MKNPMLYDMICKQPKKGGRDKGGFGGRGVSPGPVGYDELTDCTITGWLRSKERPKWTRGGDAGGWVPGGGCFYTSHACHD